MSKKIIDVYKEYINNMMNCMNEREIKQIYEYVNMKHARSKGNKNEGTNKSKLWKR